MFFVEQLVSVVCGMTAHGMCGRFEIFESARHFRIESNLEASQVPNCNSIFPPVRSWSSVLVSETVATLRVWNWKGRFGLVSLVSRIITVSGLSVIKYLLTVSASPMGFFSGLSVPKPVSTVFSTAITQWRRQNVKTARPFPGQYGRKAGH